MAAMLAYNVHAYEKDSILTVRNFYGGLRVQQHHDWLKQPYHTLYHGKIEHGAQFRTRQRILLATTYYGADSGVGLALDLFQRRAETCRRHRTRRGHAGRLRQRGDYFRFYEINPLVV